MNEDFKKAFDKHFGYLFKKNGMYKKKYEGILERAFAELAKPKKDSNIIEDCDHSDIEDGFCLICGADCTDLLMVKADYLHDLMKEE